jgi:hypothetical protein
MICICKKITEFGIFTIGDSYEYSIEKHDETGILLYNIKLPFVFSLTEEKFNINFIDLQSKRDMTLNELGI